MASLTTTQSLPRRLPQRLQSDAYQNRIEQIEQKHPSLRMRGTNLPPPNALTKGYTIGEGSGKVCKENRKKMYQTIIFSTLFVGYAVYNYVRKIFSYAAPTLMDSRLLSQTNLGMVNSAQYMAYAVSKFLGGVLSDKISTRILFPAGLLLSGLSALCVVFSLDPMVWTILWFLNGLGQGCGWPACSKLIKNWFDSKQFGTCWSVLTASSNVSGAVGPIVAAYCLASFGWKVTFVLSGALSLLIALISVILIHDSPPASSTTLLVLDSKKINENNNITINSSSKLGSHPASNGLIKLPRPPQTPANITSNGLKYPPPKPVGKASPNPTNTQPQPVAHSATATGEPSSYDQLVRTPLIWVVSFCYLIVFGTKTALADWGQVFLIKDLGETQIQASAFNSALETGGFFGGIMAGIISDRVGKKLSLGNGRLLVSTGFMSICAIGLHLLVYYTSIDTPKVMMPILGMVLGASLFGPITIFGIVASESVNPVISGTSHAIVALAANVGAILAGWPIGKAAQLVGWRSVFFFLEICVTFSVIVIYVSRKYHRVKHDKMS